MAAKGPARASLRYAKAPLSPRYQWELHQLLGHCSIEQAFSKLKSHLCKIGARTFTDLFHALGDICRMFTPDECWNFFQAAGYVSG